MSSKIIKLTGESTGEIFGLESGELTFGRSRDNTVKLVNGQASRYHGVIRRDGDHYILHDLGSSNGTLVNGERIVTPHRLYHNDQIVMGEEVFQFIDPATIDRAKRPQAQRADMPEHGVRCPGRCGKVYPLDLDHCPIDGATLANGRSVVVLPADNSDPQRRK